MAEQSQFSKLSKKQLVFICEKLVDEDFPIGNPYDSDFDSAFNILQEVSKYFSLTGKKPVFYRCLLLKTGKMFTGICCKTVICSPVF